MEEIVVKVAEEDITKLQHLFYEVDSRANLFGHLSNYDLTSNVVKDFYRSFMDEYVQLYDEYSEFKIVLENKYKPVEIKDEARSWSADFANKSMIFYI